MEWAGVVVGCVVGDVVGGGVEGVAEAGWGHPAQSRRVFGVGVEGVVGHVAGAVEGGGTPLTASRWSSVVCRACSVPGKAAYCGLLRLIAAYCGIP